MTSESEPEFFTVEQAAAYLGVTPATIRRVLRQHGLSEFLRSSMGKRVLIRREDLDALDLTHGQVRAVGQQPRRAGRNRSTGAA